MSRTSVTVRDQQQSLHSVIDEDLAHALIGSLSADPETISELQAALTRFVHPQIAGDLFSSWTSTPGFAPDTEPACVIDLAARLIASSWEHELDDGVAATPYVDLQGVSEFWYPYHLSAAWLLTSDLRSWATLAQQRREQRLRQPRIDLRQILYGDPLLEYLAGECWTAVQAGPRHLSVTDTAKVLEGKYGRNNPAHLTAREIHAEWLLRPQPQLQGRSVRDAMLSERAHIARDIEHRSHQWVAMGQCPPGLSEQDSAYRWGGLGPHEIIVYYDLVRDLLYRCLHRFVQLSSATPEAMVPWLQQLRDDWLGRPQADSTGSTPPREIIDRERRRLPLVESEELERDCDCPLCRMMEEPGAGPAFAHLGGFHLDEDFAFSFCRTREEWQEELEGFPPGDDRAPLPSRAFAPSCSSVWQTSYVNPSIAAESPTTRLFGIGAHLTELISDLKHPVESRSLIDGLNRQYDNLCQTMGPGQSDLTLPVVERFCEQLQEVADARPELTAKCADLQESLRNWFSAADPLCNSTGDRPGDE